MTVHHWCGKGQRHKPHHYGQGLWCNGFGLDAGPRACPNMERCRGCRACEACRSKTEEAAR